MNRYLVLALCFTAGVLSMLVARTSFTGDTLRRHQDPAADVQSRWDQIYQIEDDEARIIAELELAYLGVNDHAARRGLSLGRIQELAASSPESVREATLIFSRGLSIDELASLIEHDTIIRVDEIEGRYRERTGMVRKVSFRMYELWDGEPGEIIRHLLDFDLQASAISRDTRREESQTETEAWLSQPDQVRFYRLSGTMSAENLELLRSTHGDSLLYVDLKKWPFGIMRPQPIPQRLPIPSRTVR